MNTLATPRISSKGQVVIPKAICKQLNLKAGAQFVVVGEDKAYQKNDTLVVTDGNMARHNRSINDTHIS
jgi:AbrB family looped-hinge helix DNA binding protein